MIEISPISASVPTTLLALYIRIMWNTFAIAKILFRKGKQEKHEVEKKLTL